MHSSEANKLSLFLPACKIIITTTIKTAEAHLSIRAPSVQGKRMEGGIKINKVSCDLLNGTK
jgi:hypothetical protein